jgi:hypothetical protein
MLSAIESLLEAPLRIAVGDAATLVFARFTCGAELPPGSAPQVALLARKLTRRSLPLGDDDAEGREAAFFSRSVELVASPADPRRFELPPDATGVIGEVQSPTGHVLAPGDAFSVESGALLFNVAPAAPVRVSFRGERSLGYVERSAAQIEIEIGVRADSAEATDGLLSRALAAVLGVLAGRDVVDLSGADPADGLSLRLLRPIARLSQIDRDLESIETTLWHRQIASVIVRGELELTLSLGAPAPTSTIRELGIQIARIRADGSVGLDQASVTGG